MSKVRSLADHKESRPIKKNEHSSNSTVHKNISDKGLMKTKDDNAIIESNTKPKGVISMEKDYITKSELDTHNQMIDLKLDKINTTFQSEVRIVNNNIEGINKNIENINNNIKDTIKLSFYERAEIQEKETRDTRRYIIGTIIFGTITILLTIISLFKS